MHSNASARDDNLPDVARSAALVLSFTTPPRTSALTAQAVVVIGIAIALLVGVVLILTGAGA